MSYPIPARLAHLPTQGGLVVPVVAVQRGDRYAISINHTRKAMDCVRRGLCGICGDPLGRPMVVLTAQVGVDMHHATDPANHPECAAYAMAACPMLSGRMTHYRRQHADTLAGPCNVEGCGCGGFVISPTSPRHDGDPAPDGWYAVWLNGYRLALNQDRELIGLAWDEPLRVRPVPRRAS